MILPCTQFIVHNFSDFEEAAYYKEVSTNENQMPIHQNVIRNFVNVEIFFNDDTAGKDCVGWITIMEKCDKVDLRTVLKEERISIQVRKIFAKRILDGFDYLFTRGITHYDRKLENILLKNGQPKIIDYGLVAESTGRSGYRQMGYTRRGSKYKCSAALCK